ncbi:MAG: hypothetical protein R3B82_13600 [Sandaracinaceae bacterium]
MLLLLVAAPATAQRAPLTITAHGDDALAVSLTGPDGASVACRTPCRLAAEPGEYRLETEARGLRAVHATLDVGTDAARWDVRAGTGSAFVWGVILTSFGAGAVGIGAGFVALPLASASGDAYNQMMAGIAGGMCGLIGAASLIGGIVLVTSNTNGVDVSLAPAPGGGNASLRLRF